MLIQLITNQPQVLGSILKNTPAWVWGLLAGLLVLGFSQTLGRRASLRRITVMQPGERHMKIEQLIVGIGLLSVMGLPMSTRS